MLNSNLRIKSNGRPVKQALTMKSKRAVIFHHPSRNLFCSTRYRRDGLHTPDRELLRPLLPMRELDGVSSSSALPIPVFHESSTVALPPLLPLG